MADYEPGDDAIVQADKLEAKLATVRAELTETRAALAQAQAELAEAQAEATKNFDDLMKKREESNMWYRECLEEQGRRLKAQTELATVTEERDHLRRALDKAGCEHAEALADCPNRYGEDCPRDEIWNQGCPDYHDHGVWADCWTEWFQLLAATAKPKEAGDGHAD